MINDKKCSPNDILMIEPYMYCDTPGFGDNRGIMTDVANAVGIYNSIQYSKSLKIVLPF